MKKVLQIVLLYIIFLLIYFLQANFFTWFNISGVMPNIFIILVLYIGLFGGKILGSTLGFIFGICLDCVIGKSLGITGLLLGIIGYLGGEFDKNFSKDNKLTFIIMVLIATFTYEVAQYAFNIIKYEIVFEFWNFIRILIIEMLYNGILTIIFYSLIQKTGYYLEKTFKGKRILTGYYR